MNLREAVDTLLKMTQAPSEVDPIVYLRAERLRKFIEVVGPEYMAEEQGSNGCGWISPSGTVYRVKPEYHGMFPEHYAMALALAMNGVPGTDGLLQRMRYGGPKGYAPDSNYEASNVLLNRGWIRWYNGSSVRKFGLHTGDWGAGNGMPLNFELRWHQLPLLQRLLRDALEVQWFGAGEAVIDFVDTKKTVSLPVQMVLDDEQVRQALHGGVKAGREGWTSGVKWTPPGQDRIRGRAKWNVWPDTLQHQSDSVRSIDTIIDSLLAH